MQSISVCYFEETSKYLKRASNSLEDYIDRGEQGVNVRILHKENACCSVVVHQTFGHRYCVLNAPILRSSPAMVANLFDGRIVHAHLQDFAIFKGMRRQFLFKFESEKIAKKFMATFHSLQEELIGPATAIGSDGVAVEDEVMVADGVDFSADEADEEEGGTKDDDEDDMIGMCKSCGFFGGLGKLCCHCSEGQKYEEEEESDGESNAEVSDGEGSVQSGPKFIVDEGGHEDCSFDDEEYDSEDDFAATQPFPSLPLMPFDD